MLDVLLSIPLLASLTLLPPDSNLISLYIAYNLSKLHCSILYRFPLKSKHTLPFQDDIDRLVVTICEKDSSYPTVHQLHAFSTFTNTSSPKHNS